MRMPPHDDNYVVGTGEGFDVFGIEEMPSDWRMVTLASISSRAFGGGTPSTKVQSYWEGDIPWTTTALLTEEDIYLSRYQRFISRQGLVESSSQLAPRGSVLVGTRVGVGKSAVPTFDIAINQDLTALILKNDVSAEFVVLALKCKSMVHWFENNKRGTTIKGVPRDDVMRLMIPLPPFPEQKTIVRILRTVQQAKEACEGVIAATHQLKQSLLQYLFTYGPVPVNQSDQVPLKETEVGALPESWETKSLGSLFEIQQGKALNIKKQGEGNVIPFLRTANVLWGKLDLAKLDTMPFTDSELARFHLMPLDILVCEGGDVGRAAMWRDDSKVCCYQNHLHRLRSLDKTVIPDFYMRWMEVALCMRGLYMGSAIKTTIPNLSKGRLAEFLVPKPPTCIQQEIVSQLSAVDAKLAIEEIRRDALANLFQSILHHLMTGKVRVTT